MENKKEEEEMKKASLCSLVFCCAALALGVAILGCGNEGNQLITTEGDEAAVLANACGDACNTMVSCMELPDDAVDESVQSCNDNCFSPPQADLEIRNCSISCDITQECGMYEACLCDCGLEEFCLASIPGDCNDACTTMVSCMGLSDDVVEESVQSCNDNCNAPPAEDLAVRDCSLDCDRTADCGTYTQCLCGCGLEEFCQ